MKQKSELETGLKVGDRVRLIAQTLPWRAEMTLQGQIGEVIERRDDGRITIRFDNGRLLMVESPSPLSECRTRDRRRNEAKAETRSLVFQGRSPPDETGGLFEVH